MNTYGADEPSSTEAYYTAHRAFPSQPELLDTYYRDTIGPGWQVLLAAIQNARAAGGIHAPSEPDLLRDILASAIVHHLISRTGRPKEVAERKWVKC